MLLARPLPIGDLQTIREHVLPAHGNASSFEVKMFSSSTSTIAAESMNGATEYTAAESMSGVTEHVGIGAEEHMKVPIVEVAFRDGKWWSIPQEMSAELYDKYINGEDAGYTWDWGAGGRAGSWMPDGELTSINRYVIDFANGVQTNLDNQRKRSIRIIWVRPRDVVPQLTGEIPEGHLSEQ